MPFSSLTNNTVTLIKASDLSRTPNIKASVQKNKIFIDTNSILIESGDHIEHKMSNGAVDLYKVLDPGFHEEFHGMSAHYQIDVQKLGILERNNLIQNINTYNLSGNSRLNNSSVDNSINIIGSSELLDAIGTLRKAIESAGLDDHKKTNSLEIIDSIEHQAKLKNPSKVVISALVAALPSIESVTNIANSILALLK